MSETRAAVRQEGAPQQGTRRRTSPARLLKQDDVIAGGSMILIAAFLTWAGRSYPIGNLVNMGPGYLPRVLCVIIAGAGLAIIIDGYRRGFPHAEGEIEKTRVLPLLIILVGFIFFAFGSESLGLLLTSAIFTVIVSYAYPKRSLMEVILLMVGLLVLVFALWELVGVQLPLLPRFV